MDPALYERLFQVFNRARDLAGAELESCLRDACGEDLEFRARVEALLEAHASEAEPLAVAQQAIERLIPAELGANASAEPPDRIGEFRVLRRLGSGGMGVVFEVEQDRPKRRAALKLLPPNLAHGERLRRFRRESEILGRLHHPGIAQVFAAGALDQGLGEQPWFAMELIEGLPLIDFAERAGLGRTQRIELLAAVCDAVQHAHDKGIIHRDLKPDNVLVEASGRPKVLDFGIARASDLDPQLSTIQTEQGEILGTVTHMAPEQLGTDLTVIGPPTDVWGLGVLLFELLTGRLPHDLAGLSLTAAIRVLSERDPHQLKEIAPSLRGDLNTIASKALSLEPKQRYATPAALAADLRRFLAVQPILARRPSQIYRVRRYARRKPAAVLAIGIASVAILMVARFGILESRARESAEHDREIAEHSEVSRTSTLHESLQFIVRSDPWLAVDLLSEIGPEQRGWVWKWIRRQCPLTFGLEDFGESEGSFGYFRSYDDRWLAVPIFKEDEHMVYAVDLGRPDSPIPHGPFATDTLVLDQDGKRLLSYEPPSIVPSEYCVRLNVQDGSTDRMPYPFGDGKRGLEFLADGTWLLGKNDYGASWTSPTTGHSHSVEVPFDGVNGLSWNRHRLTLTDDEWLYSIDMESGEQRFKLEHNRVILRASVNPEGSVIACCDTQEVTLYDADDGVELLRFEGPDTFQGAPGSAAKMTLSWSQDSRCLLVHTSLGSAVLFDTTTGERLFDSGKRKIPVVHEGKVTAGLSGRRIVLPALNSGRPWVADTQAERVPPSKLFEGTGSYVYWLTLSLDGDLLAAITPYGYGQPHGCGVHIYDAWSGAVLARWPLGESFHLPSIGAFEFSSDGRFLFYTEGEEYDPIPLMRMDLLTGEQQCVEKLKLLDLQEASAHLVTALQNHTGLPAPHINGRSVIHPDGKRTFATRGQSFYASIHRAVSLDWNLPQDVSERARGLDVSSDGRFLALGFENEHHLSAQIMEVEDGTVVAEIPKIPSGEVLSVAWSPNGDELALGFRSGEIRVLETRNFTTQATLAVHEDYVLGLVWSQDGQRLYSGSGDGTVRLWDSVHPIPRTIQREDRANLREQWRERLGEEARQQPTVGATAERLWEESEGSPQARSALRRLAIESWSSP